MDGAGVVALIIIIVFFSNLSIKPFTPELKEPSQKTVVSSPPAPEPPPAPPPEPVFYAPISPPPPIPAVAADYSPAAYQYVEYDRMDKIIRKYNKNLPQSEVDKIKVAVNLYGREKNIDPRLLLALMARESGFNPQAVSTSGAIGLGQIMPFNYADLGITDPSDINQNVKGTVYYLKNKMEDWSGYSNQLELSLASYLKGTGDIKRAGGQFDEHTRTYIEDILKIRASI
ncbi:MAG: transglycosylase SLT domain-containing protein [Candidatus Margulisbacteria bacterium]|jgi:soluble lytic murein transglycosylase-like protein|nr:transglycosylase SLT domain-containing protein [Candidatus Margulisiibacteriota bacterium]